MGLRNFIFNSEIWTYLTTEFELDVVTTVDIRDHRSLGIRNYHNVSKTTGFRRIIRRVNDAIAERLGMIGIAQFHMLGGDPEVLDVTWAGFHSRGLGGISLFLSSIHGTFVGSIAKRVSSLFLRLHPVNDVSRSRYSLMVLGHSFSTDSVAYGMAGRRKGIPVVCSPFNLDAMKHPLVFSPDLLLLWGDEERLVFERSQLAINPQLSKTVVKVIGVPIYDIYHTAKPSGIVRTKYEIADDERIILYPAFPDSAVPFQYSLCEALIEIVKTLEPGVRIIVRLRPGMDSKLWHEFAWKHKDFVVLQLPEGAAFDKTGSRTEFVYGTEREEMALYADTLASASLLVSPAFTTMIPDAFTIGTPAVAVPIDMSESELPVGIAARYARWFSAETVRFPAWRSMPVMKDGQELKAAVTAAVSSERSRLPVPEEFRHFIVHQTDGKVGERWVASVSEMLTMDVDNRRQQEIQGT